MDDSANGRYEMILGRDLLPYLGINLKFYDPVTKADGGHFKGYMTPMVDIITYEFTD